MQLFAEEVSKLVSITADRILPSCYKICRRLSQAIGMKVKNTNPDLKNRFSTRKEVIETNSFDRHHEAANGRPTAFPGGHILIHEMLYKDEKTGPFPMAAFSMIILGWTEGEQYSGTEISEMLREAGFGNIQAESAKAYG